MQHASETKVFRLRQFLRISNRASIIQVLNQIRSCPALYIGNGNIRDLAYFLRGYQHAYEELIGNRNDTFLTDFQ